MPRHVSRTTRPRLLSILSTGSVVLRRYLAAAVLVTLFAADAEAALRMLPLPQVPCDEAALRNAIETADSGVVRLGACTYVVGPRESAAEPNGIVIAAKTGRLRIEGTSGTVVRFRADVMYGFRIAGPLTTLELANLTIEGEVTDPNPTFRPPDVQPTIGIYGSPVRGDSLILASLTIRNLNGGIAVRGLCDTLTLNVAVVKRNSVSATHGDIGGSGIATACIGRTEIQRNTIERAGRHGIYHWRTRDVVPNSDAHDVVIVDDNLVLDHRHDSRSTDWTRSAITVARSNWVAVVNNVIVNSHSIPLSVEHDIGLDSKHVLLANNRVIGPSLNPRRRDVWINVDSGTVVHVWYNRDSENRAATVELTSGIVRSTRAGTGWLEGSSGDGMFYALAGDTLYRVVPQYGLNHNPNSWGTSHSTTSWGGAQSMATMGDRYVYVMQRNRLQRVTPDTTSSWWPYLQDNADWSAFHGMTAMGGRLYVVQHGCLRVVVPSDSTGSWSRQDRGCGWRGLGAMRAGVDGLVYVFAGGRTQAIGADGAVVRSFVER